MTSREAFEAALTRAIEEQKDPRFYSTIDAINWAWQAAIQHASDVATAKCAEISEREHLDFKGLNPDAPPGKRGNSYVEGLSDGADLAGDAIKEALNTGAATPGNKGTTPNS